MSNIADIKPGAIIVKKWGYDQTNVDFYIVRRTTAKSVVLQMVASKIVSGDGWTGRVVPDLGEPSGSEFRKALSFDSSGEPYVRMTYGTGRVWSGEPSYYSATA